MRVFLSYRRDDAAGQAGRLRDALAARFGADAIFHDVSTIRPGENFVDVMTSAIAASDVVLVVIGPRWTTIADGNRPRLQDPDDYVHFELQAALASGKRIIPVTVAGASVPAAADLPEDLRALLTRQATDLRDTHWGADLEALLEALEPGRPPTVGGASLTRTRARAALGALGVTAIVVVALVLWRPWTGPSGGGQAVLPLCAPVPTTDSGWTAIDLGGEPSVTRGTLTFEARAAGYSAVASDRWALQVLVRITNGGTGDPEYNADWQYAGIVTDGLLYPLQCFSLVAGGELVGPGLSGDALIGIEPSAEPSGRIEVALGEGGRFAVGAAP
ncbi:MAG: toll/interleukin-1 receptor domain-containing protein [Chloroflexi bacterium]|nr:toll/interleukin-1 receptor domain-containing protein [Chloroflexota bacterium]MDA1003470.1 toll/interleukin-1 receptor domain-containing protein [Chloroflexota bacterium]